MAAIGANSAAAGTFVALTASGAVALDGGAFVFNNSKADLDFRFAGDDETNLLFGDAAEDKIYIGHNATIPVYGTSSPLQVHGNSPLSLFRWVASAAAP